MTAVMERSLGARRDAALAAAVEQGPLRAGFLPAGPGLDRYHTDWYGTADVTAPVLRPSDTEAVRAALLLCREHGIRLVVQGGMTGLVRACLPQSGEVILSSERLQGVEIDARQSTALVGAGVTLAALDAAARSHGLMFPVDMGSRGSATLGGMIATNAGGNRVLRYGMTRASVLGLEAVLPDGTILSNLSPLFKNNTGYDLKQLLVGSEGTLGIVTRALVQLVPVPQARRVALVSARTLADAMAFLVHARATLGPMLSGFEIMWRDYTDVALALPAASPVKGFAFDALTVLLEVTGASEDAVTEALETCVGDHLERHPDTDAIVAQSEAQADTLWTLRDLSGEAATAFAPFAGFDVSLPLDEMEGWVAEARGGLAAAGFDRVQFYGHLGDGNLHVVVALGDKARKDAAEEIVYGALAGRRGSVSAEHGIGMSKRRWLPLSRTPEELSVMRRLKSAFDPDGILNNNRLFNKE
ncbi:FAD-binding oxidoreductase [Mesobacterium pallidum]|uniref:FAD-binding oxidoreductase n=1 Tax=Mesobacterium pallidum TaxID=2872037 RepID=UPI001EE1DF94|nr:FAD-binding oxidoreductase [Mesobacterium pallidum]